MTQEKANSAIIIGSGIAGLAAAIRLRLMGYAVKVFEANEAPGGKIREFHQDGFRFDTGPSLLTMPWLVDNLFTLAGVDPRDYFQYEVMQEGTFYWFADGTEVKPGKGDQALEEALANNLDEPAFNIRKFLDHSERLYHITSHVFLERSLHDPANYLRWATLGSFLQLPALGIGKTMAGANQKWFRDKRVRQLFNRYATFNGSDPYRAPAVLNVIPHLEHNLGAYFPKGGIYRIIESLHQLADSLGIAFSFQDQVQEIVVKNGKVQGVRDGAGDLVEAGLVVSNVDVDVTYRQLLPSGHFPHFYLDRPKSSSALIFYWNVKGHHPELGLHNVFFSGNYGEEFHKLFNEKALTDDPTVYVYISARANTNDAPDDGENWYVMINAPNEAGQNWEALVKKARSRILEKLSAKLGYSIEPLIAGESIWSPPGIARQTSAYRGALYGNNSNNAFAAFLRHPNFSRQTKGLYFCGGSVHPGGGIPLCLMSAKIVADLVKSKKD